MGFWSGGGKNVFTANVLSKVWDKNKEKVSERLAPRGGELGKAYRNVRGKTADLADAATTNMESVGLDKPGGEFGRFTDWVASLDDKGQKLMWGHSSYDDNTPAPPGSEEDLLKGSRRGLQGIGKNRRVGTEDERRQPYEMGPGTLLTQGQKAKKLKHTA